ncbi:MAG: DUF1461 domain-containing protein [Deferribacterales bacterium]
MMRTTNRFLLNLLLIATLVYYALFAGWYISYSNYFFFPVIYQMTDIHGHVLKFAPQNRMGKADFAFVGSGTHMKMFSEMLKSVENDGEGLAEITYPAGRNGKKALLTPDEVVHLQDVADLISLLRSFWRLMLIMLLSVVGIMIYGRYRPYGLTALAWSGALLGGALWLAVSKFGFVSIFYALHRMVFPEGHKWFFYYQDSLMSTVLKAPDSFIYFGVILGIFALLVFVAGYKLVQFILGALMNRFLS